ncbi:hypothetical protein [uncultured Clostridium sp.]|uniref:hypothetical protein n=1 Tax=uncultured Clostridium sp. TaxID=59620 RepID=UPI0026253F30|nr:hypothetical protein [uncultured Clostridium sp.]
MKILNPYEYEGTFLKGNLHTHSENSPCGHYSLDKIVEMYTSYKMEYDFLSITDHCMITDLSEFKDREDILLIQGVEFKRSGKQTLGINLETYDDDGENYTNHNELFKKVVENGGINIICHPHLGKMDYWTLDELLNLENYTGIEIFNNNVRLDCKGIALATDLWDELLSRGKRVFGFADDDMHIFSRAGGAYNYVLAKEKSKEEIMNGLRRGSFYASFGVKVKEIEVKNNRISLKKGDERVPYVFFKFIGKNGVVLKECKGTEAYYDVVGNEGYIRVEVFREDGAKAWLQPFFIEE